MPAKTRPSFSNRMHLDRPLDDFSAPSNEPTWTGSHHKHTVWLSDEVWEALGMESSRADASKSSLIEDAVRTALNMAQH